MTGRRNLFLGAIASLVALVVVGLIGYQVVVSSQNTVTGYMVTQAVVAGGALNETNFQSVSVKQGDFTLLQQSPTGEVATHPLAVGDLIRPDDVAASSSAAQVTISLGSTPPLTAGDLIDIYTEVGNQTILLGHNLPVITGGNNPTIQVPSSDAPYWVAIISSGKSLLGVRLLDASSKAIQSIDNTQALSHLSGLTDAQVGGQAGASRSASPSPSQTP